MVMWIEENNSLRREFIFNDFKEAMAFVTKVSLLAEQRDHHPEIWVLYNKVQLVFTTHDSNNTVTEKDCSIALIIDTWFS